MRELSEMMEMFYNLTMVGLNERYTFVKTNQITHLKSVQLIVTIKNQPSLVWLSGLSASLRSKRSPVRFIVRAYA